MTNPAKKLSLVLWVLWLIIVTCFRIACYYIALFLLIFKHDTQGACLFLLLNIANPPNLTLIGKETPDGK